jgi:hypothetical protein
MTARSRSERMGSKATGPPGWWWGYVRGDGMTVGKADRP